MFTLNIDGVKKSFGTKSVLSGASFVFEKGKIYGLIGRNGAGKTTLFNCINSDLSQDEGSITIHSEQGVRPVTTDDIGYVLSEPIVPDFLTAGEFIKFLIEIQPKNDRVFLSPEEYLDQMSITPEDNAKLLKDFSHGMKNKIQMLVNFIIDPPILLLDEPLTSLDIVVADEMKKILRGKSEDHIIIFSTHILELALDLCDEIVILSGGVLEEVPKGGLDDLGFKERIISALRDSGDENDK